MKKTILHLFECSGFLPGCLTMLLFFISSTSLFAQSDTIKKLKEVKVSSSKTQTIQTVTPSQQISSDDFSRYSSLDVADAIRNFSGVNLKDYGGIGGLKTVSVRGLGANHTAVLYDGVQINDAENGQIDLSKFNLNGVQAITLYNGQPPNICQPARSFASASILAIETIKPHLDALKPYLITAGIKAGSFGLVNPYLQWQERLSNNWSFVINSYIENANGRYKYKPDDTKDSLATRTNTDIKVQQVNGDLYWAKNDSNKFNLHINYYNSDRGLPGAVVDKTTSNQRLGNRDFFAQAGYERIWNTGLQLLLNSKFSKNDLHYLNPDFLNAQGELDQRFMQNEFYQSATLSYTITSNWEVSYATDLSINNLDVDFNYPYPTFPHPTRFTLLNVLASNLALGILRLQGSLLNTHISETVKTGTAAPTRNNYSPTLMAVVEPFNSPDFQIRSFYKSIFRNPTFDDLYYGGIGNPNLKPEYTHQYDLGATYSKNLNGVFDYISLTADAYYNDVTNKIVFIPKDTYNGSIQNYGKVDIKGLDAGLKTQAKLGAGWKGLLAVNYSYQQALNVTDPTSSIYLNQLPYTPKNTVALNAGINKGVIGIYYNQVISSSRYYTNDNLPYDLLPAYAISDASVVYKNSINHLPVMASFEVNNLFDKNYTIVRSYPMPGRSYRLTFQITI
jgi:vitamin B12 transporter